MQQTVLPLPVADLRGWRAWRVVLWASSLLRPFWVVPAGWSSAAVVMGLLIPYVELTWLSGYVPLLFPGDLDGARAVLTTIAGAMISVTGLVFSITMVVLQLASSQYSPRVLQTFLEDRVTQHTLGIFAASFLYALTVLRSVSGRDGVPQLGVTGAFVLVLGAVAMFLAFIHHITRSVGVASVLQRTAQESRRLLRDGQRSSWPETATQVDDLAHQRILVAPRSGYLDRVDVAPLVSAAARHDVRIEVLHPLGAFVVDGSPLARVHGDTDDCLEEAMEAASTHLTLAGDRSMQQDTGYGLRRLVDVAERALSPGINDPTTALQVVDHLHDLLRRMVTAPATWPVRCDAEGVPRVVLHQPTLAVVVELALSDIAHWGAEHRRVTERIAEIMAELRAASRDEHRPGLG